MTSDSSTGGFLQPVEIVFAGEALEDTIHDFIAGVTGLPGEMVRPKWVSKASKQPEPGVNWCAFGIIEEGDDELPSERHVGAGEGFNVVDSHDPFPVLVSFYGGNSHANVTKLFLGLGVAQNREYLYHRDMAFVECGRRIHVPELLAQVWNDRWDLTVTFRRHIANSYKVLNIEKLDLIVTSDSGIKVRSR